MARHVKGVLFVDYVRMLRAHRHLPWRRYLDDVDLPYIEQRIEPAEWYPLATFERIGLALLGSVAAGDLERVRQWGRLSAADLVSSVDGIVVPGDPRESLMRFHVYRRSFFDFEALTMLHIDDRAADVQIAYGMSPPAEEAASIQAQGFFEGLIELADGSDIRAELAERSWTGAAQTLLRLSWSLPASTE
jgi:hypothetical protein